MCINGVLHDLPYDMKPFGNTRNPSKRNLCSTLAFKLFPIVVDFFQNIESIIKSRGELHKNYFGAELVHLLKTVHRKSENKKYSRKKNQTKHKYIQKFSN